ncbi:MAG TPA: ABC transporter [Clostridiales bacterium]|nr:ABC transporter [Clostridiales bacterium]
MANKQNKLASWIKKTNFKHGTNATILIVAVIAIAVLLNVLVDSFGIKADLTPNRLYSIHDRTVEVLSNLNKDVEIYGLFDETTFRQNDRDKSILEMLDKYGKYEHVSLIYVDPERDPALIKTLDPANVLELSANDFVVKSGEKTKKVPYNSLFKSEFNYQTFQTTITGSVAEEKFTGAVKFVTADATPYVYFLTGHGENDLTNEYTLLKDTLENNNYLVGTLNLLTDPDIPDETEILIMASPKTDITDDERVLIEDYVVNGGNLMVMVDALNEDPTFNELNKLLQLFNLAVEYDQVKENDSSRYLPGSQYTLVPIVAKNTINSALNPEKFAMILPKSRSIEILRNEKEYVTTIPLLTTSKQAIGEPISEGRNEIDGPLNLAVAVDYQGGYKPAKIVVMGNANYIKDDYIYAYQQYSINAFYFFANTLFWMRDDADTIYIAAKSYEMPKLALTQQQAKTIGIVSIIVLPVIILGIGLFVFLRRRHL